MALRSTDTAAHPYRRLRGATGPTDGSRGVPAHVRVRATLVADLLDEVRAAGQEMVHAGKVVEYGVMSDQPSVALRAAASLQVRGRRYAEGGGR